jgi:redox-sensitive bicupin YhaK (pirin superfamily)
MATISCLAGGTIDPMMQIRKSGARGRAYHGWARSAYSFSFGDYFDIAHQGHGSLFVLNEDAIAPGGGFPEHDHRNVEIVSYVLAGELAHRDSLGNAAVLRRGDVQRMSAGTGVVHSEFNNLQDSPVHFLQMWFNPLERDISPQYEQRHFADPVRRNRLVRVVSRDGQDGSLRIHADAAVEAGIFEAGVAWSQPLHPARLAYLHVARGALQVNGQQLGSGDAALLDDVDTLSLLASAEAEVLVFNLAH